jgi:hypothetical protein
VKKEGPNKWSQATDIISGRTGKQIRERWYNNLSPNVVKGDWSLEEDYQIFTLFEKFGS